MVLISSIHNNSNSSSGKKQETLRRLAKKVISNSSVKERKIEQVMESHSNYTTTEYIPAQTYIYNISSQACMNDKLKESLSFLNSKAAVKILNENPVIMAYAEKEDEITEDDNSNILFNINFDNKANIFAA